MMLSERVDRQNEQLTQISNVTMNRKLIMKIKQTSLFLLNLENNS